MIADYGVWGPYNDLLAGQPHPRFTTWMRQLSAPPARILEMGVGSGRLALPLADEGFDVVGIDASPTMLELLAQNDPDGKIKAILGDFATSDVSACGSEFDIVLLAYNALSMQPDLDAQRATLANAASAVREGGYVVIENPSERAVLSQINERNQALGVQFVDGNAWLYLARYFPDSRRYLARFMGFEGGGVVERSGDLTLISVDEIVGLGREVGLECIRVAAAWDGSPFLPSSEQYVMTLKRVSEPQSEPSGR